MQKTLTKLAVLSTLFFNGYAKSQNLSTVTGLRLYEHHSSEINNGAPFGNGANGFQSGYDFVNRTYYYSFNEMNFGPYLNAEYMNIDMVEHNGPFGNGSSFGFTSAYSSIWNGEIRGNNTTLWMIAPAGFDYNAINNVNQISSVFNTNMAGKAITAVQTDQVYLGKIRNSNLYVAVKCTKAQNTSSTGGQANVYFDFEYKYGTLNNTSVPAVKTQTTLLPYPNPAKDFIKVSCEQGYKIYNQLGAVVLVSLDSVSEINISTLPSGIYTICTDGGTGRFIKE